MPGGTGFDLLARLEHVPRVIFTTAYDDHAVQAFEVNALDYLLKPIEPERLAAALARARGPASKPQPTPGASPQQQIVERLFIRDGARCWFVPLHEVCLIVAEGNYVRLHWRDVRPLLGRPLEQPRRAPRSAALLPRESPPDHQRRVHRDRGARHQRPTARPAARRPGSRDLAPPGTRLQGADERMIPAL